MRCSLVRLRTARVRRRSARATRSRPSICSIYTGRVRTAADGRRPHRGPTGTNWPDHSVERLRREGRIELPKHRLASAPSPTTMGADIIFLVSALNWAVEERLLPKNPILGCDRPKTPKPKRPLATYDRYERTPLKGGTAGFEPAASCTPFRWESGHIRRKSRDFEEVVGIRPTSQQADPGQERTQTTAETIAASRARKRPPSGGRFVAAMSRAQCVSPSSRHLALHTTSHGCATHRPPQLQHEGGDDHSEHRARGFGPRGVAGATTGSGRTCAAAPARADIRDRLGSVTVGPAVRGRIPGRTQ